MDLEQENNILIKAYHECLYQKKSLERPLLYWKNELIKLKDTNEPLTKRERQRKREIKTSLKRYIKDNKQYARKLLHIGKVITSKITEINIMLEILESCENE